MARQNRKVHRAQRAVARETGVAVERVVHDVANEEEGGEREGQEHAGAMRLLIAMLNEIQAYAERSRAQSVEGRIKGRQKHPAPSKIGRSMVQVEQPQEE